MLLDVGDNNYGDDNLAETIMFVEEMNTFGKTYF